MRRERPFLRYCGLLPPNNGADHRFSQLPAQIQLLTPRTPADAFAGRRRTAVRLNGLAIRTNSVWQNEANSRNLQIHAQRIPLGLSCLPIVYLLPTRDGGKTLIGNGIFLTIP